jgi:DNA modification methylase
VEIDLRQGDCLELMKSIPDNSIDLILTDPPYGTTACKWDSVIPFEPMWEQLKRIRKERAAICLFGSEPFSSHLRMSNIKEFKYDWIWNKGKAANFANCKKNPLKITEIISIFNSKIYYPQMEKRIFRKKGGYKSKSEALNTRGTPQSFSDLYYPKNILDYSTASNKDTNFHPTQKPVPLLEYLIKTYTLEGETVLDFTMGSGSTGVACVNTNRRFIGIEKDQNYFEIGKNRIEEARWKLI